MQAIINEFVLVRINVHTNESTVIMQSDDRQELLHLKGVLESNIHMDMFNTYQYKIKEKKEILSAIH